MFPSPKLITSSIVLIFLTWGFIGGVWFVFDCALNEAEWSRLAPGEPDYGFLLGGPLVWLYSLAVLFAVGLLILGSWLLEIVL
jgi:hypothetical protein